MNSHCRKYRYIDVLLPHVFGNIMCLRFPFNKFNITSNRKCQVICLSLNSGKNNFKWYKSQVICLSLNSGKNYFLKERGNTWTWFANVCYNTTAIHLVFVYWIIWSMSRAPDKSLEVDLVARRAAHNLTAAFFLTFSRGRNWRDGQLDVPSRGFSKKLLISFCKHIYSSVPKKMHLADLHVIGRFKINFSFSAPSPKVLWFGIELVFQRTLFPLHFVLKFVFSKTKISKATVLFYWVVNNMTQVLKMIRF